ncbi:TPA: hypothetical protein ACT9BD_003064, partial [Legionella pneumophila]
SLLLEKISKINSFKHIINEIDAEVDTLTLNDEAANRFRNFNEICDRKECCMFLVSNESYGKNLLYLKDQIKDLEKNIDLLSLEKEILNGEITELSKGIETLNDNKQETVSKSSAEKLAETVSLNAKRLVEIETKIKGYEQIILQKDKLDNLIIAREHSHFKIDNLTNDLATVTDKKIIEVQLELGKKINEWLQTLETTGITGNAHIESGFKFQFGNEDYTRLDGSLRIRAILAFHAALFEYCLENALYHPRILILDTPKQQELDMTNLKDYFNKLKQLCVKFKDAQIVFSSSEYDFVGDSFDEIWKPSFIENNNEMYLGRK